LCPEFGEITQLVEFPKDAYVYMLSFPYGAKVGDEVYQYIPLPNGQLVPIDSEILPNDLKKDLEYGRRNAPLGFYFEKCFELFQDHQSYNLTETQRIESPGNFFSFSPLLRVEGKRNYIANGLDTIVAGARSCFLIPEIKCQNKHMQMCSSLDIMAQIPPSYYEQFFLFKKISQALNSSWSAKIIYFPNSWLSHVRASEYWNKFEKYFCDLLTERLAYLAFQNKFQSTFYTAMKRASIEVDSYMTGLFTHLINICMGDVPGYFPAIDESLLPLKELQESFVHRYKINKKIPTIMIPKHYYFEKLGDSVFFSLECKSGFSLLPKRKNNLSRKQESKIISGIFNDFLDGLIYKDQRCNDTALSDGLNKTQFEFLTAHDAASIQHAIRREKGFTQTMLSELNNEYTLAHDANFFKSGIRISSI
jgi:hypothetical protein